MTLLAGRPKVGKTTLLFPLIAALEQGRPFLDRPTFATRVLMLSEEREQTLAEKRQLYLDGADPLLLMRHEQDGRTWPELIEQARAYCAEHEIGVLVIDTWDKWTGLRGDDESKAGAVIEALEPLMLAAGDGLAVLIVAHQRKAAGKHGEAVRGSNAITGGVDVIVELERAPEELGRRMRVLRAESRFTATPEELVGELTEDGGYIAQGELEEVRREAEGESIAELVEAAPGVDHRRARRGVGHRPRDDGAQAQGRARGRLRRAQGSGRKGDPYRWHPLKKRLPHSRISLVRHRTLKVRLRTRQHEVTTRKAQTPRPQDRQHRRVRRRANPRPDPEGQLPPRTHLHGGKPLMVHGRTLTEFLLAGAQDRDERRTCRCGCGVSIAGRRAGTLPTSPMAVAYGLTGPLGAQPNPNPRAEPM